MSGKDKITEVLMPVMGEGITEVTLVRWLKKTGDKVAKAEPLLEVSTDKVDTEIPSPESGYLIQTWAAEGANVSVNSTIAHIADSASAKVSAPDHIAAAPVKSAPSGSSARSASAVALVPVRQPGDRVRSSPLVRKMALAHQVDLQQVAGSGLGGRINKHDLLGFLQGGTKSGSASAATTHNDRLVTQKNAAGQETLDGVIVKREKMSKMRKLIAEHMVRSVRVSPHVTTVFEIDLQQVVKIRDAAKEKFAAKEGFNLTFTHFFLHATVQAIKQHPMVNVSVDGDEILHKEDINIGCAVALPTGLIVPVIKKAQNMSLRQIAVALNDLVVRARNKKLNPDDVQGGTFSVTNPGGYGSLTSNPIINQPQVAILGIGKVAKRAVVIDDEIVIRPQILISLTFDHRIVDGEGGAKYLATLQQILENYQDSPLA